MEFIGLGVELAQLAGRFGSVDPPSADRRALEWSVGAARRLRGMIDAHEAAVTFHLETMVGRPGGDEEPDVDPASDAGAEGSGAGDAGSGPAGDGADGSGAGGGVGDRGAGAGTGDRGSEGGASDGADGSDGSGGGHRETAEEYRLRLRRAKWLRRLPLFAAALEAGQITTAHVEALAAVVDHVEPTVVAEVVADEAALVEIACTVTRASFARYLRVRVDRVRDDGGRARLERQIAESFGSLGFDDDLGLHRLFVRLDPLRGEQVYTAIRRRVDELQQSGAVEGMRRGQVIAQAVTDLICGAATTATGTGGVEVLVVVDLLTLLDGTRDTSVCETGDGLAVPVEVVRDLCHQPGTTITAAVRDPEGVTVAIGHHTGDPPADPCAEPAADPTSPPDRPAGDPARQPDGPAADPTRPPDGPAAEPTRSTAASGRRLASGGETTGFGGTDGMAVGPGAASGSDVARSMAALAAMVAAAITAARGEHLDRGRDLRLANRLQRRALRAMYRSCAHPDCREPFADCFVHHVTPWEHDGPTDLANLLPLCGTHHHQVHEGGWHLTIDADRTLAWHRPGGRLHTRAPFQPLGATVAPCFTDDRRSAHDHDEHPSDDAARWPETAAAGAPTSTSWNRSRNARGAPPTAPTASDDHQELRLFDPTAA